MKIIQSLGLGLTAAATLSAFVPAQEEAKKPQKMRAVRAVPLTMMAAGPAPTQEQLVERRDAKLAEAWIDKAAWILDYDVARETARKDQKKIFAYFTRSYSP